MLAGAPSARKARPDTSITLSGGKGVALGVAGAPGATWTPWHEASTATVSKAIPSRPGYLRETRTVCQSAVPRRCSEAVDCLGTPRGTAGYDALARAAAPKDLGDGLVVKVVALEDIMLMKKAAGRPKDLIELEVLGALRDEIARG
ncbi:MAG: hypothetical protein QOE92_168 [Chloroflexota bacterium]|nr:hypothetical protein [Chloroflexota bacterium]